MTARKKPYTLPKNTGNSYFGTTIYKPKQVQHALKAGTITRSDARGYRSDRKDWAGAIKDRTAAAKDMFGDFLPGGKKKGPRTPGVKSGGGVKTAPAAAYAEADLTTTSLIRAQGKAYAMKKASSAGTARGGTYKPKEEGESAVVGKGKRGVKKGGGHKSQGIPKGYHVNASGQIVPNKGKKKGKK